MRPSKSRIVCTGFGILEYQAWIRPNLQLMLYAGIDQGVMVPFCRHWCSNVASHSYVGLDLFGNCILLFSLENRNALSWYYIIRYWLKFSNMYWCSLNFIRSAFSSVHC
jgi:hypothetical protein